MRDITGMRINSDAIVVGISASGLWMLTAKYPRAKMAWMLLKLSAKTLIRKKYQILDF